jgi:hypothetical protein
MSAEMSTTFEQAVTAFGYNPDDMIPSGEWQDGYSAGYGWLCPDGNVILCDGFRGPHVAQTSLRQQIRRRLTFWQYHHDAAERAVVALDKTAVIRPGQVPFGWPSRVFGPPTGTDEQRDDMNRLLAISTKMIAKLGPFTELSEHELTMLMVSRPKVTKPKPGVAVAETEAVGV